MELCMERVSRTVETARIEIDFDQLNRDAHKYTEGDFTINEAVIVEWVVCDYSYIDPALLGENVTSELAQKIAEWLYDYYYDTLQYDLEYSWSDYEDANFYYDYV